MNGIKRREFIRKSMITGIGTPLAASQLTSLAIEPEEILPNPSKKKKIIVAGAGITGLCCAYELMQKGHDVVVLEAKGRHGGHVYTGRDGLTDGLYADYGADHITRPGYERFFEYAKKFNLPVLPYPHAEGSDAAPNRHGLRMINKKFYTDEELADPAVLRKFGFNDKEITHLSSRPWYALQRISTNTLTRSKTSTNRSPRDTTTGTRFPCPTCTKRKAPRKRLSNILGAITSLRYLPFGAWQQLKQGKYPPTREKRSD